MKLLDHFDTFLREIVNLNDTRLTQLEDSVDAIKTFIRGAGWGPRVREFVPQGSWAHKTIIKPVEGRAFDADLLVYVNEKTGWEAKDYIDRLYDVFSEHGTYKSMVRRYSHCVTIEYTGERKIDVAPCIVDRGGFIRNEVCNRVDNQFQTSRPKHYTAWLNDRNDWTGTNGLRKVTRLLKYMRDIKETFTCPSFLLTTLLGLQISAADEYGNDFADVPTALKTTIGRLDNWLQARPVKPDVSNPVLSAEIISGAWDDTKYANFRDKIHTYREWIDDAYAEEDRDESIGKWRRIFGDDFAANAVIEEGRSVGDKAIALIKSASLASTSMTGDLVSLVTTMGRAALGAGVEKLFQHIPYMHRPKWRAVDQLTPVTVSTTLHSSKDGPSSGAITSLQPLRPGNWLKFQALTATGTPFGDAFDVQWRITNTDRAASEAGCLRGDFYPSDRGHVRWETLRYRGVHLAEAFVIRKRDGRLIGMSPRFYVVIE